MPLRPIGPELVAHYVDAGVWQTRALYEIVDGHAARDPAREAACDQTRRLSYAEVVAESKSFAHFLLDAGIQDGDCVAVQSPNVVELAVAHLACNRVGATFIPLSDAWRRTEIRHLMTLAGAKIMLVPPARDHDFHADVTSLRADLPELKLLASLNGGGDFDLREVLARRIDFVARAVDPNAPRYVMASSGTTSLPKLSLWTDNNLWAFGEAWSDAVELTSEDRMVGLAPAGTGAIGYVYGVLFPLLRGATSILLEHWSAPEALELIEREQATIVTAVPTQIVKMLLEPKVAEIRVPDLRVVTNAGAPLPPDAAAAIEKAWDCRIQTVYGATDGGVPLMTNVGDPAEKRHTTVGRTIPLTDLLLVDEEMRPVEPGARGEVLWTGPTKSFGYLNEPDRTEEMFWGDGYYRSGDLGEVDSDGYVRIVGRAKDLIIRGGQNISPREIEEAVAKHPAVAEVAAVGVPDAVYGERVCVAVALRDGASLDLPDLLGFLQAQQLAAFKLPERLELFGELPKNASGKTSKQDVLTLVLER